MAVFSSRGLVHRLPFGLLIVLCGVLWMAGGASRADQPGQVVVRGAAWSCIVLAMLFAPPPNWRSVRPVAIILAAAIVLVSLQLIPLPPGVWRHLPGRSDLAEAAVLSGQMQPWRPLAIVPGMAVNALGSLVVPAAVVLLVAGSTQTDRARLPGFMLLLVILTAFVGALQFSGVALGNPIVNYSPGDVSGNFANRNHFALFLALGCAIAPAWAFYGRHRPGWRAPTALGLVALFILLVLASGSRAGVLLAICGSVAGMVLVRRHIRHALDGKPRWLFPMIVTIIVVTIAAIVALSISSDRAVSINRVIATEGSEDMRARALPTVVGMIGTYLPVGAGFGSFEPLFRKDESFALLKPTYFNHAHNDFLEVVLEGGMPGALLLIAALGWFGYTTLKAWRNSGHEDREARLASVLILLIIAGSIVDYPGRTPLIMAIIVIAGSGLVRNGQPMAVRTLPKRGQHL